MYQSEGQITFDPHINIGEKEDIMADKIKTRRKRKRKAVPIWCLCFILCVLIAVKLYYNSKPTENVYESFETIDLDSIPEYSGDAYITINNNMPFDDLLQLDSNSFEDYWDLDALGRCTGAVACLGTDLMPTEERGSISEVKPTGWQSVEYEFVEQNYLYNRCHLIGYQLSGENANENNLITGTRYMNVEGMLPFENMVAEYIKDTDNHVYYRVRPMFEEDDLVARGVLMEAYSVEDNGSGICYNIFCYNNQPGVEINYADGSSVADEDYVVEKKVNLSENKSESVKYAEKKESEKKDLSELYDENGNDYVLNIRRMKIHKPDCKSVQDMSSKNAYEIKAYIDVLMEEGYSPCQICKPE